MRMLKNILLFCVLLFSVSVFADTQPQAQTQTQADPNEPFVQATMLIILVMQIKRKKRRLLKTLFLKWVRLLN
jgi:hypothetical protein